MRKLNFSNFIAFSAIVLALMSCALQNHYVLLHFGDTAKYLQYGFGWTHEGAIFSAGYGLFLLVASAHYSLWLAVALQCVIGAAILKASIVRVLGQVNPWVPAGIIGFLCYTTSLSRLASSVMPDFFVGMAFLSLFLLITAQTTRQILWAGIAVTLLGTMHTSLWPIYILVGIVALPFRKYAGYVTLAPVAGRAAFMFAVLPLTLLWHWFLAKDLYVSKTTPVMVVARWAETGVLDHYLARHCPDGAHPALCAYQGKFTTDVHFIFNPEGPLFKINPSQSWEATFTDPIVVKELKRVIWGVLADPVLYPHLAVMSLTSWGKALVYMTYYADSQPFDVFISRITEYVPIDRMDYLNSLQANRSWSIQYDNAIIVRYKEYVSIALLSLVILLTRWRFWPKMLRLQFGLLVIFILTHGLICGAFSGPHPRYPDRVNWLLVFMAVLTLITAFRQQINKRLSSLFTGE